MSSLTGIARGAVQGAVLVAGLATFVAFISQYDLVDAVVAAPLDMLARLAAFAGIGALGNAALVVLLGSDRASASAVRDK